MDFKNFILLSEQLTIQQYATRRGSDGYYFG